MGCWNKTCGLSNLYIKAGQEAYVFPLVKRSQDGERCYSHAFWKPMLLPFVTEYNDYGGGENTEPYISKIAFEIIKNVLVEKKQGKNPYHDIPVKKEGFGEQQFFDAVHEGRLVMEDTKLVFNDKDETYQRLQIEAPIDFVMFRKDVVVKLLKNWAVEDYVGHGKGTYGYEKSYVKYTYADVVRDIPAFVRRIQTLAKEAHHPIPEYTEAMGTREQYDEMVEVLQKMNTRPYMMPSIVHDIAREFDDNCKEPNGSLAARFINIRNDGYNEFEGEVRKDLIVQALRSEDTSEDFQIRRLKFLQAIALGSFINMYMECYRKLWMPAGHEGSQIQETDGYYALMSAMQAALAYDRAGYDDGDDEEDDDPIEFEL